jgi:aryl-alcohol dehydrogenase-like predicted oxidoreductase
MSNPTPSRPSTSPTSSLPNSGALRATDAGTGHFRDRFKARFADDHFRATTFGPTVTSIGIGTYLGESTDDDDRAYETAIRHAVESGINLVDTAINYRSQRSERNVGTALQKLFAAGTTTREQLVVCTKGGYIPLDRIPPASRDEYRAYVKREFFDSLIVHPDEVVAGGHSLAPRFLRYCLAKSRQNLGVRTIDVYYVHNPAQQLASVAPDEWRRRMADAFNVLEEGAARGEIGVYGAATWDELRVPPEDKGHVSLEELVQIAHGISGDAHRFRAIQLPVNLAMTEAVRTPTQMVGGKLVTVLEAAEALGITVIGSATLMQAQLVAGLPDAVRNHFPGLTTDAQRGIAFSRSVAGLSAALVGMKRVEHVDENLIAAHVAAS